METVVERTPSKLNHQQMEMLAKQPEVDADNINDWWNTMPDIVKADVDAALKELENGQTIPHAEIKKKYLQWFVK